MAFADKGRNGATGRGRTAGTVRRVDADSWATGWWRQAVFGPRDQGTRRHSGRPFRDLGGTGTLERVSDAATRDLDGPHGTGLLPRDLTDAEFAALPVLESLEQLEIEDLTDDEYEKFVAAIS